MPISKHKKLGINFVTILLGNFSSKLLSFFLIPLYTSVLSTGDYGTSDLISTTVTLLVPFATLNLGEALLRFALDKEKDNKVVFCSGIRIAAISMTVTLLLTPIVLLFPSINQYYLFLVLSLIGSSLYTMLGYFARGIGAVKHYSIAGVLSTLTLITSNIVFLLVIKIGLVGYLTSIVLSEFVSSIYLILCPQIRKSLSLSSGYYNKTESRAMFNYSGPMIPNSISWWISNSSDKYILTAFSGVTVNGIYAISYKIPSILSIITSVFSNAWILSAVEKFGSKESEDFYNDIYDKYISLSLICTSALILLGRFFALFIFANEFYEAWKYQPILIIGVAFHALSGFLGSVFSAAKKTKMLFYSTLIGALTNIVLNFVLIPVLSAYGAAIATTLSYVIVYVVRAVNSKKYIKLKMDYKKVLLSLLCLVGQMCSIYLFDYIINVFSVVLFIVLLLLNKGLVIDTYKAVIVKRKKNL